MFTSMTSYQTHGINLTKKEDIGDLILLDVISNSVYHIFVYKCTKFQFPGFPIMGDTKILVQSEETLSGVYLDLITLC